MADKPVIDFSPSIIVVEGKVFDGRASQTIKNNVGEWVGDLADQGVELVRAGIRTKAGTGYTAAGVEAYHSRPNSLYATVRMKPGLARRGSPAWPAERRPYIVNSVLASGMYRGERSRTRLDHWGKAARKLRQLAKRPPNLLKGL